MLLAGVSKVDITPEIGGWMDGMPRSHGSEGIHDPLFARALVIVNDKNNNEKIVIVSCDVCSIQLFTANEVRKSISEKTSIPVENMIIACTHTHSGPATHGFFGPADEKYIKERFMPKIIRAVCEANGSLRPAAIGRAVGKEDTISYYRRLRTKEGKIIMNWEEYPQDKIVGPAEDGDPEVGVLKVVSSDNPESVIAVLYNHAGHPNVMSGENFLISADYPGLASKVIEEKCGGIAMFLNGTQGSVDIDGLKDRDWKGVDRTGTALGTVVAGIAGKIKPEDNVKIAATSRKFDIPVRNMTSGEINWAKKIVEKSTGEAVTLRDGIGDEWTAKLFLELNRKKGTQTSMEMVGIAVGDTAFVSFPGELFTEIGKNIKKQSPFKHTYIIDLANGYAGYFPTKKAINEGGYEVEIRNHDVSAEEIIMKNSMDILKKLHDTVG